jgi:hypothetical protein
MATWRILRFKHTKREFKLRICGNGKRHNRFLLAEFLLNFFASSSRSYVNSVVPLAFAIRRLNAGEA